MANQPDFPASPEISVDCASYPPMSAAGADTYFAMGANPDRPPSGAAYGH
jgi:hypothetical protein